MQDEQMKRDFNPTKIISHQIPECIDFGFCCINQRITKNFKLFNYHKTPQSFEFSDTFFEITPKNGIISPNHQEIIQISCTFNEAKVIIGKTELNVSNEEIMTIKISGIGKYPFFQLSRQKIHFSNVLIGEAFIEELQIINMSEVDTQFQIFEEKEDDFNDKCIKISHKTGILPSQKSFLLKVTYKPKIPEFVSYQRLRIKSIGGNEEFLEVFGKSMRMVGRINKKIISFRQIKIGQSAQDQIIIYNDLAKEMNFEFLNICQIFTLSQTKGRIAPNSYIKIALRFTPTKPLNYFQRIFCFIQNQDIYYVDIYGSCRQLFERPDPLSNYLDEPLGTDSKSKLFKISRKNTQRHLLPSSFQKFEKENQSQNQVEENDLYDNESKHTNLHQIPELIKTRKFERDEQIKIFDHIFHESQKKNHLFYISNQYVNFGQLPLSSNKLQKIIVVSNTSDGITLNFNFFLKESNFHIEPKKFVLLPEEQKKLTVTFAPTKECKFYFNEVYVAISSQQTKNLEKNSHEFIDHENKLVLEEFRIKLIGDTFSFKKPPFIPMININPKNSALFPPCKINEKSYRSIQLTNLTDTPCFFEIMDLNQPFDVYPKFGLIKAESFINIFIEFNPLQQDYYHDTLNFKFNLHHKKKLQLRGYCMNSFLHLPNQGQLYFVPCYLGVQTLKQYKIRNTGRMGVDVRIEVPEVYQEELTFQPSSFYLPANETQNIVSKFVPFKKMKYKIKCPVFTNDEDEDSYRYKLQIFGEGKDGELKLTPEEINFGIIMVNFIKNGKFILTNDSDTTFNVQVQIEIEGDWSEEEKVELLSYLSSDFTQGIIPSKSSKSVNINFNPKNICDYRVRLIAYVTSNVQDIEDSYTNIKAVSFLTLKSNYPLLKIINVKNNYMSLANLWEKFNIKEINSELKKSLSLCDKNIKTVLLKNQEDRKDPLFQWDFGYIHGNNKQEKQREIRMVFQNIGGTDLEWKFQVDEESRYKLQSQEENLMMDFNKTLFEKQYFSFKPKKGKLAPFETQKIIVTYHPYSEEENLANHKERSGEQEHLLNAFISIQNGKTIKLQLKGHTLSSFQGRVELQSTKITLPSLPINLKQSVEVPILLTNIGSNNVKYKIDLNKFFSENKINPNEQVIKFLNYESNLHQNDQKFLIVQFKPNSVCKYLFKAELQVFDFFKKIQTIEFILEGEGTTKNEQILQNPFFKNNDYIQVDKTLFQYEENLVYLSEELLNFKNIKYGQQYKRILFLYNHSTTNNLTFNFDNQKLFKEKEFFISPKQGQLKPKEKIMITFSLYLKAQPIFIEGEISCKITWQSEKSRKSIINPYEEDIMKSEKEEVIFIRIKQSPDIFHHIEIFQKENMDESLKLEILNRSNDNLFDQVFKIFYLNVFQTQKMMKSINDFQSESLQCFQDYEQIDIFSTNAIQNFINGDEEEENIIRDIYEKREYQNQLKEDQALIKQKELSNKIFKNFISELLIKNLTAVLNEELLVEKIGQEELMGTQNLTGIVSNNKDNAELVKMFKKMKHK